MPAAEKVIVEGGVPVMTYEGGAPVAGGLIVKDTLLLGSVVLSVHFVAVTPVKTLNGVPITAEPSPVQLTMGLM